MAAKTPRPAGIHRSSPADDTRGAPRTRCRRVDPLVGTVSAYLSVGLVSSVSVLRGMSEVPPGRAVGGAWARLRVGVCPRTPGLTSVLDSGWLPVGYMMCDGVFRQMVLRPLGLSRPSPGVGSAAECRELAAVHRVMVGLAARQFEQERLAGDGLEGGLAELCEEGRVAGGVAAPGSLGSRRDGLPSPGSSHQLFSTRGSTASGRTGRALAPGVRSTIA